MNNLQSTKRFWDANPCDGQPTHADRMRLRYAKEPWLPERLEALARANERIVEIGCGQGTDAIYMAEFMPGDGFCVGLDLSEQSVRNASSAARSLAGKSCAPLSFMIGNSEALPFADDSLDCVYSMGALHHTASPSTALDEIHRVLKPGGTVFVYLYRTACPKVFAAHGLRALQKGLDAILRTDRSIYRLIRGRHLERFLGTALLECFGVPFLASYREHEARSLFGKFTLSSVTPRGGNLPAALTRFLPGSLPPADKRFGVFWEIAARKPAPGAGRSAASGRTG